MKVKRKRRLFTIILTGLSGSGKTVALNALEDSGFFCVDNLPTSLIKSFVDLCYRTPTITKAALGMDVRERGFLRSFSDTVSAMKKRNGVEIIFLEAKEDVLIRRFKETRRPHPLGHGDIKKAIHDEAKMIAGIRQLADKIIDTSSLSPHELRKNIINSYSQNKVKALAVTLLSFGYKYGIPHEADLLFDVRFLPNPNFIERLKPLTGTNKKVRDFVLRQSDTSVFLERLYGLLDFLLPLYKQEGRSYLTIGIGCTGGRHRSPAITEEVRKFFKRKRLPVSVVHRDIG
ncbi:MAG: RNase adapter RapZ [Nitrospirae bacterium]|nr:RNase adapter RapZ [Nitrospirota bacterium]